MAGHGNPINMVDPGGPIIYPEDLAEMIKKDPN
jgi:hypothetical protein